MKTKIFTLFIMLSVFLFLSPKTWAWNDGPAPCGTLCCGPSGETRPPVTPGPDEWCCKMSGETLCHYACSNQYYKGEYCVETCKMPPPPPPQPTSEPRPNATSTVNSCVSYSKGQDCLGMQVGGVLAKGETISVTSYSKEPAPVNNTIFYRSTKFNVEIDGVLTLTSSAVNAVKIPASELPPGSPTTAGDEYFRSVWYYKIPDVLSNPTTTFRISSDNLCSSTATQQPPNYYMDSPRMGLLEQAHRYVSKLNSALVSSNHSQAVLGASIEPTRKRSLQLQWFIPNILQISSTPLPPNPSATSDCASVTFKITN